MGKNVTCESLRGEAKRRTSGIRARFADGREENLDFWAKTAIVLVRINVYHVIVVRLLNDRAFFRKEQMKLHIRSRR